MANSTIKKIKGIIDELIDFTVIELNDNKAVKRIEREVDPSLLYIAYNVDENGEVVSIELDGLKQLLEEGEE